jgi:hypothetical protein
MRCEEEEEKLFFFFFPPSKNLFEERRGEFQELRELLLGEGDLN